MSIEKCKAENTMEQINECDGQHSATAVASVGDVLQNMDLSTGNNVRPPKNPAENIVSSAVNEDQSANTSADLERPIRANHSLEMEIIELKDMLKTSERENFELSIKNKKLEAKVLSAEKEIASIYLSNLDAIKKKLTHEVKIDKFNHNRMIAELEKCNDVLTAENEIYSQIISNFEVESAETVQRINNVTKSLEESNAVLEELNQKYATMDTKTVSILRKYDLKVFQMATKNLAEITSLQGEKRALCCDLQNLIKLLNGDAATQFEFYEFYGEHGAVGEERNLVDLMARVIFAARQLVIRYQNLEVVLRAVHSENERIDTVIANFKNRMKSRVADQAELLDDLTQVNEFLEKDVRSLFEKIEK